MLCDEELFHALENRGRIKRFQSAKNHGRNVLSAAYTSVGKGKEEDPGGGNAEGHSAGILKTLVLSRHMILSGE